MLKWLRMFVNTYGVFLRGIFSRKINRQRGRLFMTIGPKSDREIIDDLKFKLSKLEAEQEKLQKEMDRIERDKKAILDEMALHTSKDYEQNMLQLVYEQRHKN